MGDKDGDNGLNRDDNDDLKSTNGVNGEHNTQHDCGDDVMVTDDWVDRDVRKPAENDDKGDRDDREQGGDGDRMCQMIDKTRCQTHNCNLECVLVN